MKVETRLAKGASPVETDLTLDWTGVTPEKMKELAERSVVISVQRVYRDAGKIPATDKIIVKDFMEGKGRPERQLTPEKVLANVEKMTPEQRAELLKKLQAPAKK